MNLPDPETGSIDHAARILTLNMEFELTKTLSEESIAYILERAAEAEVWKNYGMILVQVAGNYRDLAESDIKALEAEVSQLQANNRELAAENREVTRSNDVKESQIVELERQLGSLEREFDNR